MALIIEDGTQVNGSNSYATDAEFAAHAAIRGFVIPATEALRDELMIKSMDYLSGMEPNMKGERVSSTQSLSYPRTGVSIYGFIIESDTIPVRLKSAQIEAAFAAYSQDLLTNQIVSNVQSEAVDVISTSYFSVGDKTRIKLDRVMAFLTPLLYDTNKLLRV